MTTERKKLLAIDGGGIRGVIALEILARLEAQLRAVYQAPDLVFADWFDFIGGTSTGAVIASALALGLDVARVRKLYTDQARAMFTRSTLWNRLRSKYTHAALAQMLKDTLGADTTLGSPKLRTLLLLVLRNATTDSPWPLTNNPRAKYNDRSRPDCNLDLPLWQLVRASTAAPTYFPAEVIRIGKHDFVFQDGAVTVYNNPALLMWRMATQSVYQLEWPSGEDRMLLVSIGTGTSARADGALTPKQMTLLYHAKQVPSALINGALVEQDFLCRILGRCTFGGPIDSEVGALTAGAADGSSKLFTYVRYNPDLSAAGLAALEVQGVSPSDVQRLDGIGYVDEMQRVGRAYAERVLLEHLGPFAPQRT